MYGNYMIAMCDILGFSNLVENRPLDDVVEGTVNWYQRSLHHAVHNREFPEHVPTLDELQDQELLGVTWFSDTILLYTLADTDDAVRQILAAIGWLIFETMLSYSPSVRSGIAYGRAYMDSENDRYVGQPIIDAYRLEADQQWSGGALTQSAVERVPPQARDGEYADWWVTPYSVPMKQGAFDTLAIEWTLGIHEPGYDVPWSTDIAEPTEQDWESRPSVCQKWQNTREFHRHVCRWCD